MKEELKLEVLEDLIADFVDPNGYDNTIYYSSSIELPQEEILGYKFVKKDCLKGFLLKSDKPLLFANKDQSLASLIEYTYFMKEFNQKYPFIGSIEEREGNLEYMSMNPFSVVDFK